MYMLANLGEPQSKEDCSGWERDPESFSKRVAEHYARTVLGKTLHAKRIFPYWPSSKKVGKFCFQTISPSVSALSNSRLRHCTPIARSTTWARSLLHLLLYAAGRSAYC